MKRIAFIIALAIVSVIALAGIASATPAVQLGTNQGAQSLCMNRNGGGTSHGTFIIGYNCGDNNNDFEYIALSSECHDGHVHAFAPYGPCPFSYAPFDQIYDGASIVAIEDYQHNNNCAGTSASNTFTLRLEDCPVASVGGGWNSHWVVPGWDNSGTHNAYDCVISIHSTNAYGGSTNFYNAVEQGYTGGVAITTGNNNPNCSLGGQWAEIFG